MKYINKKYLYILISAIFLAVIVIILALSLIFSEGSKSTPELNPPSPTPIRYNQDNKGEFRFSPLQKTEIGKTKEAEITKITSIINKQQVENKIIYTITSATPNDTDEVITKDGIVIFENTNIFNLKSGNPPKFSVYEDEFGKPEKILNSVSPLGKHISAYIYAANGFTLFVNSNTNTVYEIHRFVPTSTENYLEEYSEYLQPAPAYPQESFK